MSRMACARSGVFCLLTIFGSLVVPTNTWADQSSGAASRTTFRVSVDNSVASSNDQTLAEQIAQVLEARVRLFGDPIPSVQINADDEILVDVPASWDVEQVRALLERPGELDFREEQPTDGEPSWIPAVGRAVDGSEQALTGSYLDHASLQIDRGTGRPSVEFQLNDAGAALMAQITRRLVGQRLGVFLDDELLMAPTVQAEIRSGTGLITGNFSVDEATRIAAELNAGPLPVAVRVDQERVGSTSPSPRL